MFKSAVTRLWPTRLQSLVVGILLIGWLLTACDSGPTLAPNPAVTPGIAGITPGATASYPPILFVHGNGDSSALWITILWRFESNGYPAERLFTIDFPHPTARDDNTKLQTNRSSTDEQRTQLATRVDEVLSLTGATKLILVGNSRGGYSIRNFLKNRGGVSKVQAAILSGTPNHGVIKAPLNTDNEFNGDGPFLKGLNSGPNEVVAGVPFLTIRSDKNDKFAQPMSVENPLGVGYDGPALNGATNVALDGVDHRETAYSPRAFQEIYKFITGNSPASTDIKPETNSQLSGLITGYENEAATNLPVSNVAVSIFEIDHKTGTRIGGAVYQVTTGADGAWGSFKAKPDAYYEFVVQAPGDWERHFFRTPFPRSSKLVTMRLYNSKDDKPTPGKAVIIFTRPRGYFAGNRDKALLDGKPIPGMKDGVPTIASLRVEFDGPERAVPATLHNEAMTVRAIPNAVVYAEFQQ